MCYAPTMFENFPAYDPSASPMTEDQAPAQQEALWGNVFKAHELTVKQRYPYRVRAAYRFAREVAIAIGALREDELMSHTFPEDPFNTPMRDQIDLSVGKHQRIFQKQTREIYCAFDNVLGLGPPPLPNPMPKKYNPSRHMSQDRPYVAFATVLENTFGYLRILEGSIEDPDQGWLGTCTFTDPVMLRETWPEWDHVREFEDFLVQETLEEYANHGEHKARELLHRKYGFTSNELRGAIKMARTEVIRRAEFDIDFHKAMAIKRLEDVVRRARDACNLNMELRAIKELNLVTGLGKVAPEDTFQVFAEAVTELALEGRTQHRLQSSMEALPPLLEAELVNNPRRED